MLCLTLHRATILPPTPRPTGRLPRGLCRHSARRVAAHNGRSFDSNVDSNNDASDDGFNFRNDVASNAWYNAACNRPHSSRRSSLSSYRRSRGRSSLHSERYLGRYFLTNDERYFDGLNRGFAARYLRLPELGTVPGNRLGNAERRTSKFEPRTSDFRLLCEETVPVFRSSPRPSPQRGEGERSEGEEDSGPGRLWGEIAADGSARLTAVRPGID
jgi:hypothetical protein